MKTILKFYHLLDKKKKTYSFFLIFLLFVGSLFELLSLAMIIPILQLIVDPDKIYPYIDFLPLKDFFNSLSRELLLILIIGLTVSLFIFKNFYILFVYWLQQRFLRNFSTMISSKLFKCYLKKNYIYFTEKNSSNFIKSLGNDTETLNSNLGYCGFIILEVFTIFFISALLFVIQPLGLIVTLTFYFLGSLFFLILLKKKTKIWSLEREFFAKTRIKHLKQIVESVRDIKLLKLENIFMNNFNHHNNNFFKVMAKHQTMLGVPRLWIEIITVIVIFALVLILLNIKTFEAKSILPILGLYSAAAFKLIPSFNKIISGIQSLRFMKPVLNEYYNEISNYNEPDEININKNKISFNNTIQLKNINFSYDSKNILFKNFSFTISKGEKIGIYGESGSGKSTFLDIFTGLIIPQNGEILVDGVNINKNIDSWRSIFAYQSQNTTLVDDTIKNNILLGNNQNFDFDNFNKSIHLSVLNTFVKSLVKKENTIIGERGAKLSGGQKQRIGLARTFYLNRDMIILDESTNALDEETENKILENIWEKYKNKTIIIVSHNKNILKKCEKIIEFNQSGLVKY